MNKTVNQIWLGGEMPERERAWCDGVRKAAEAAGWKYRLWRDGDIAEAFGDEPVAGVFRAAREVLPGPVTYTLESDYYRLRVLADEGGLYLDTDFECSSWPEWPSDGDVWTMPEQFNATLPCTGLFWILNPEAARIAADMAADRLTGALDPDSSRFASSYIALVRRDNGGLVSVIGPRWLRNKVRPAVEAAGCGWGLVGTDVAGHIRWSERGPLCHHGVAAWHEGKRSEQAALWTARAVEAEKHASLAQNANARVLVMVQSCQGYKDRKARRRDAAGCAKSRKAIRLTWWKEMPANMEAFFVVGRGPSCNESGVVRLDVPDDYAHLPAKTIAGIRWALKNRDWDFLVKVDDDTYVHGARLAQYCNKLQRGTPDIHGGASLPGDFFLCGGAGYILSRQMAEKVAADTGIPDNGAEDVEVCASVLRHGGSVVKSPLFNMGKSQVPTRDNDLITAHHLRFSDIYRVHNGTLPQH